MKIPCKSIFLTLLLLAGMATANAGQGRGGRHSDDAQQGYAEQREAQQGYGGEREAQQRYGGERGVQRNDRACSGPNGCEQSWPTANSRAPSKGSGRMTPEERSALRRQINEAGQDVYSGKYRR